MKKQQLYEYLGTNGVICTPVFLENIYHVKKIKLTAEKGKLLTKDHKHFRTSVIIPESEVNLWYEV